jgi:hypothetical protein
MLRQQIQIDQDSAIVSPSIYRIVLFTVQKANFPFFSWLPLTVKMGAFFFLLVQSSKGDIEAVYDIRFWGYCIFNYGRIALTPGFQNLYAIFPIPKKIFYHIS